MRVLMLAWEYPPVVVGGLGRHVHALSTRLAKQGHEVTVLSRHRAGTDAVTHPTSDSMVRGVRLIRIAEDPPHVEFEHDLVAWTFAMGHAMVRAGLRLTAQWQPDVVHAHDWLVAHPAIALAENCAVPLVATIHATEAGRHSGWLSQRLNQQVHSVEWWLANRADRVITCSAAMRDEVGTLFDVPSEAVTVLHNGIEPGKWRRRKDAARSARERLAVDGVPLLVSFGRLEWEKGIQDLIAALRSIRRFHPGTRLVVAGTGSHRQWLADRARHHRVRRAVTFVGHLPDRELVALLAAADMVVLPSRYEPFGLAALEAAAAGAPLVASHVGGLGEVVLDGVTGLSFAPGDTKGIVSGVCSVLDDPRAARRRAKAASTRLASEFNWELIAADTARVYAASTRHDAGALGRPKIPTGNAFG